MDKIDFLKIRYVCTSQDITITGNKQRVANRRTSVPRACLAKDAHPGGSAELRHPKGNGAVSKRAEAEQVSREAQESEHAPRDLPQGDKAVSGHRHFCQKAERERMDPVKRGKGCGATGNVTRCWRKCGSAKPPETAFGGPCPVNLCRSWNRAVPLSVVTQKR